jgi:hypothetical protein
MMTSNRRTHAIILLCKTVASFLALGIDNLCFDLTQLDDPLSNYFPSLAARAINCPVTVIQHPALT